MADLQEEKWARENELLAEAVRVAAQKLLSHSKAASISMPLSDDGSAWLFAGDLETVRTMAADARSGA